MKYDHTNAQSRLHLGAALLATLDKAGFTEASFRAKEAVYERDIEGVSGCRVLVYTSIVGGEVREVGTDAIRVVAMREMNDGERPIARTTRVHRTGQIEDICARMLGRMREAYKAGKAAARTKCRDCGYPMFVSKKHNLVCGQLCWQKKKRT